MWQTKYASAVLKNLGVGVNFGRAVKAISSLGVRVQVHPTVDLALNFHKKNTPLLS
jgi:hypothetical protein